MHFFPENEIYSFSKHFLLETPLTGRNIYVKSFETSTDPLSKVYNTTFCIFI